MVPPTADEALAVYRYKRQPTPLERIHLGFWILLVVCFVSPMSPFMADLKTLRISAFLTALMMVVLLVRGFPGWSRKAALEIYRDHFTGEVLPGKTKKIWFATIVELAESDFDLRITHLTDKGYASFSLWRKHFGAEKWPEIVAVIQEAASRQSPRLQVHGLKSD